jgi:hypothetical protein
LQEEVRKLHFMLKSKEVIIEKMKAALEKTLTTGDSSDFKFEDGGEDNNDKNLDLKRINSLLDKDGQIEKESK